MPLGTVGSAWCVSERGSPPLSGRRRPSRAKRANVPEAADDTRPDSRADDAAWFGAMRDTGEVVGDLVSPASDLSDWDVLRSETGRSGTRPAEGR